MGFYRFYFHKNLICRRILEKYIGLRPIYTKYQWLIWSISVNTWFISDQLGLQSIYAWFIKKSKQFNQSNIDSDITALTQKLSINRPLLMGLTGHFTCFGDGAVEERSYQRDLRRSEDADRFSSQTIPVLFQELLPIVLNLHGSDW